MKPSKVVGYVLFGLFILVVGRMAFKPAIPPVEVNVGFVGRGDVERIASSVSAGTVDPVRSITLVAEVPGRVLEVLRREGDWVEAGEAIARIDGRDLETQLANARLDLDTARATLADAEARRDQTRLDYRRTYELFQEGVLPKSAVEKTLAAQRVTETEVDRLAASIAKVERTLQDLARKVDDLTLAAPFRGMIARLHVDPGDLAVPKQPVVEVIDPSRLEIDAVMNEADAGSLRVGLPVRVLADALPDEPIEGRLAHISPVVSSPGPADLGQRRSRGIAVTVSIERPPAALKVGMSADVDVILDRVDDVVQLPARAVRRDGDRSYAFTIPEARVAVGKRAKAARVAIETGLYSFDGVEVTAGLGEGQPVILNPERVQEGTVVKVAEVVARSGNER